MNTNKIVNTVVVGASVALIAYAGYHFYKLWKKDQEAIISPEELQSEIDAMRIVEEASKKSEAMEEWYEESMSDEEGEDPVDDLGYSDLDAYFNEERTIERERDVIATVVSGLYEKPMPSEFLETLSKMGDDTWGNYIHRQISKEKLNHVIELEDDDDEIKEAEIPKNTGGSLMNIDANSPQAWEAYVRMMTIDLVNFDDLVLNEDYIKIMEKLFTTPFVPCNGEDATVREAILQRRVEFFGEDSIYADIEKCSFGELILYFAEKAEYDIDGHIADYCDDWLDIMGITLEMGEYSLSERVEAVCNHYYTGARGYGMFGLDQGQYDEEVLKFGGSMIERTDQISFRIEYEVWLNGMMEIIGEDEEDDYDE